MSTIILQYTDDGWLVRWRSSSSEEFGATREAFKAILPLLERYWDPEAFDGKGGWWVYHGSLDQVSHLFSNYWDVQGPLEQQHQLHFEQMQRVAREQRIREEALRRMREHGTSGRQKSLRQRKKPGQQKARPQPKPQPKREEVKLPQTMAEALRVLKLTAPVTASDVKRAYREQARKCHPDHGGSHAAMVNVNAAYELALSACS